jgi:hypothetical protein
MNGAAPIKPRMSTGENHSNPLYGLIVRPRIARSIRTGAELESCGFVV